MRVNTGGDPGRDDYGLPPVDIEVPDDARELDRDVQAYRREVRSLRRRMLVRRLAGPLTSDGMVLPLLAGCLALTLLAATLLTVFTVGQGTVGGPLSRPASASSGSGGPVIGGSGAGASLGPATGRPGGQLPSTLVQVDGQPEHLTDITGPGEFVVVLALIPPGCKCLRDLRQLTAEATAEGAEPYLVGMRGENVSQFSVQTGLGQGHVVEDSEDMLPPYYRDRNTLTAVLVARDGSVAQLITDRNGFQIKAAVRQLVATHAEQSPSPGATAAGATPSGSPSSGSLSSGSPSPAPTSSATSPG
jgi:hypothetical protein